MEGFFRCECGNIDVENDCGLEVFFDDDNENIDCSLVNMIQRSYEMNLDSSNNEWKCGSCVSGEDMMGSSTKKKPNRTPVDKNTAGKDSEVKGLDMAPDIFSMKRRGYFPPFLIVKLRRFQSGGIEKKINKGVEFPLTELVLRVCKTVMLFL
jgi:hypothetical protein